MFTRRIILGALCLGLFVAATPLTAAAADAVTLKVSVVHATKTAKEADPALSGIQKSLEQVFGSYKAFTQLDKRELSLALDKTGEIKLPNGTTAVFTYKGKKGSQHQLKLKIPESKVDVDLRAPAGKLFYQAGLKHQNGILIMALLAKDKK